MIYVRAAFARIVLCAAASSAAAVALSGCGARPPSADGGQASKPTPTEHWTAPKGPVETPIPASVQYAGRDGHPQEIDGVRWYWCIGDPNGDD